MSNDTTITIIGNLTADPELGFTRGGDAYARFVIASTPRRYDRTSNGWTDGETIFLRCTAWRDLAEHAAESLTKGVRVIVTGRLRQNSWTTDDGQQRSSIDLDVDEVGPSLQWATAKITKATRTERQSRPDTAPAGGDPWTTTPAGQGQPVPAGAPADAPPF